MDYDIKVDLIPGLPQRPYRNGVGAYEGIVIHDTECNGDSDESEVTYFKNNWKSRSAFVHYFVDGDSISQTAKAEYQAWGAGSANPRYLHIEMCSASSKEDFEQVYDRTCWLAATKLYERNLDVIDEKTLVSHKWVTDNLGGTTHQDPIAYLAKWGKTWADLVKDVKAKYNSFGNTQTIAKVIVNDKLVGNGVNIDGHIYMGLREVGEALGKSVSWDNAKKLAYFDGKPVSDFKLIDNKTYIQVATAGQILGAKVSWDNSNKKVYIYK